MVSALLLFLSSRAVVAQTIAVSGDPGAFVVSSAIAGSEPAPVASGTTTYTVVTPNANRTYAITARLDAAMPFGTSLVAVFAPPPQATSVGPVALDMTARNVVTDIPRRVTATSNITYQFAATVAAGVIPSTTRTLTLTIVQFP